MLRLRLMTAGAAAALLMAPVALAQSQTSNPPNVGEVPETEVNASSPRPNPGETTAPPAPTQPWTPETPSENAVPYSQADDEGWSEPDSAPPADPLNPPADPMEPPADSAIPPPPIDPAPDAGLEDDDPLDPEPPGA